VSHLLNINFLIAWCGWESNAEVAEDATW
jgi:hypothetical protein